MTAVDKQLVTRDGAVIAYQILGQTNKEVVLFLHGNSQNHHYFIKQKQRFSQQFKTIWLDTRDHGRSTNPQETLTFEMIVEDLHELVVREHITKLSMVGFSDGANVALLFAKYYPSYVKKLVLISPNVTVAGIKAFQRYKTELLLKVLRGLCLKKWARRVQLSLTDTGLSKDDLQQFTFPILLVQGERDVIYAGHLEKVAEQLSHAKLEIVNYTGHSVPFLRPRWFNERVLSFLNETTSVHIEKREL
ncbi:alpha/beta fold hydrolase [Vagococcus zengguangii]|uniref:alpha/beta fold hydrolase n=1 Tax=Vagococcus zengguangii TaxID=2571750 RepID=UPI0014852CF0|nr:alpha/beta hydrolase [Vagococcus zengguangii]